MKISIIPQKKLEERDSKAILGIRITLSVEGTTKKDKEALRTLWSTIDDTKDIETLLTIIKDFNSKKGEK